MEEVKKARGDFDSSFKTALGIDNFSVNLINNKKIINLKN